MGTQSVIHCKNYQTKDLVRQLQSLLHIHSTFFLIMFNFTIIRSSSAIAAIHCDVLNGLALVSYKNGSIYAYSNVSRRAMMNLKFNSTISLGFWVNNNLLGYDSQVNVANLSDLSFNQIQAFCNA
jgi:hypothetical protein